MINYELAKELKDAGFPQIHVNYETKGTATAMTRYYMGVYYPTLSELIGACGDEFVELIKMNKEDDVNYGWEAGTDGYRIVGNTPEEAVARLWLELNKKDNIRTTDTQLDGSGGKPLGTFETGDSHFGIKKKTDDSR